MPNNVLLRVLPFLNWLKGYRVVDVKADIVAGMTVAVVLVPQSMAYAQLAGLPPYYGLYASFLPPMFASLFGSSRQLATGPVAIVSLMTSAALAPLATSGSQSYFAYAILLALLVGLFQLALGVLRLGLVVNFLSHPVVNGFTNAAALIIATSQLSKIFGVYVDKSSHHYETVLRVVEAAVHHIHWPTFALAVFAFAVMIVLKRINPRIPNVLVAVMVTTIISWAIGYENNRVVPVRQVASPDAKELIAEFNTCLAEIEQKSEQRVALNKRLQEPEAPATQGSRAVMELEHDLAIVSLEMEGLSEHATELRKMLRGLRLYCVPSEGGECSFYERSNVPEGSEIEGPAWRLKVGNRQLDTDALMLMGGGAVVGRIPEGLPDIGLPTVDVGVALHLFPMAAVISLLGFMEAISIAKAIAGKAGYRLDPNQELVGQGLSNIVASFSSGYAVSGSFSRSAVNFQSGARTGISNVISSAVVALVLLFLTPLLYHLPQAVLAAIIMMAVVGLVNVSGFIHAWKAQKHDGIIGVITFVCTLAFAPHLENGVFVGIGLSLASHLLRSMKPDIALLAKHPDGTYQNRSRFNLRQCKHIVAIRFSGPLFFANSDYLEETVLDVVASMPDLKQVVLAGNAISELDASGEEALSRLVVQLREAGYDISVTGVNENVLDVMRRTYLDEKIGGDHFFPSVAMAVDEVYAETHEGSDEDPCPMKRADFVGIGVSGDVHLKPEIVKQIEERRAQLEQESDRPQDPSQ